MTASSMPSGRQPKPEMYSTVQPSVTALLRMPSMAYSRRFPCARVNWQLSVFTQLVRRNTSIRRP